MYRLRACEVANTSRRLSMNNRNTEIQDNGKLTSQIIIIIIIIIAIIIIIIIMIIIIIITEK